MKRLLRDVPVAVAATWPWRGKCGLCGFEDARHRMFDSLTGQMRAGDSLRVVARDFEVSLAAVVALRDWWREP